MVVRLLRARENAENISSFLLVLRLGRQDPASFSPDTPLGSQKKVGSSMKSPPGRVSVVFPLVAVLATSGLLIASVLSLAATSASAVGTSNNSITASSAPSAASARGSYAASATATSGDKVGITLDSTSTGCTLSTGTVTFTVAGTCVVNFNDPGNATYAAAALVSQSIKVYAANTITVSKSPAAGSSGGSYSPGATATSNDTVARTLSSASTGCSLSDGKVSFNGAGTCRVDFNDAGNGAFAAATEVQQSVKVYAENLIHPSTAPAAGTIHGTYTASASATSGDVVSITLGGSSTGCTLDKDVVTFTKNGVCEVDFNDAGNGAFGGAVQIRQSITVGTGNPKSQVTLTLTSVADEYGTPLTLTSSGGSGTGTVTYSVTWIGTAGCSITTGVLHSSRAGTCSIMATKAGDDTYASISSVATAVNIAPPIPHASRMSGPVWTGRTSTTSIIGSGFYGTPRIVSNARGTRVSVTRDNGHVLTIRVKVGTHSAKGEHRFTLVFAHGQRASLRYRQR